MHASHILAGLMRLLHLIDYVIQRQGRGIDHPCIIRRRSDNRLGHKRPRIKT